MEAVEDERILRWQPIVIKTINQEVLRFCNNLSRIVIIWKSFLILPRYENGLKNHYLRGQKFKKKIMMN